MSLGRGDSHVQISITYSSSPTKYKVKTKERKRKQDEKREREGKKNIKKRSTSYSLCPFLFLPSPPPTSLHTDSIADISTSHHPKSILSKYGQLLRSAATSSGPTFTLPLKLTDLSSLLASKHAPLSILVKQNKT